MLNSNFSCLCSLALCTSSTTCLGSCCTGLPSQSWSIYLWQHSRVLISSIGGERGLTFALLFCFFFFGTVLWLAVLKADYRKQKMAFCHFLLLQAAWDCQRLPDYSWLALEAALKHGLHSSLQSFSSNLILWRHTHTQKKNHSIFGVQITTSAAKRFINSIKQQHRLPRTDIGSMKVFKTWLKKTSSDLLPPWDFPSTLPTRVILQSFEWSL